MWAFYPFEKLVFKNVLKILLINIWIFIPLLIYMWGVEGVTWRTPVDAPIKRVNKMEGILVTRDRDRLRKVICKIIQKNLAVNGLSKLLKHVIVWSM